MRFDRLNANGVCMNALDLHIDNTVSMRFSKLNCLKTRMERAHFIWCQSATTSFLIRCTSRAHAMTYPARCHFVCSRQRVR
jgi:hypothetical protein